jgi:NAD(P)-dependent dehydrogenase (short-subunit alcohol dehydrogenase family)
MAKIFITGSSEGLGHLAGKKLMDQGHQVVLHARNEERARQTKVSSPQAEAIVIGDVSTLKGMRSVAEQVNKLGRFNAVIHNVGVFQVPNRSETVDHVTKLFAVNVLAPYVLTALIERPERLIYMSSGMHLGGEANLKDPQWKERAWDTMQAYSDSKLWDVVLTKALARRWPHSFVNAVNPGWVPTRMGGAGAPDDLDQGAETQVWLSVSDEADAQVTGQYFHHKKKAKSNPAADDPQTQEDLLEYLEKLSNIRMP